MSPEHHIEDWLAKAVAKAEEALGLTAPAESAIKPPVKIPPGQILGFHTSGQTSTSVALAWKMPTTGTLPIRFTVFVRRHGAPYWAIGALSSTPFVTVHSLKPGISYDFEVLAHNN